MDGKNTVNGTIDGEVIKEFRNLDPSVQELINAAIDARKRAYCPYSNFPVGAAIRTESGEIFVGCNIENGAYGPSICAERTAAVKAISEGHRKFLACAVVAFQEHVFTTPCGLCRQFLAEFAEQDFPIYIAKPSPLRVLCLSVFKLLPHQFIPMKINDIGNNNQTLR